jgi:hypothetical protein
VITHALTAGWHVPEDAGGRRVELEHFGSEVLEPGFGEIDGRLSGLSLEESHARAH